MVKASLTLALIFAAIHTSTRPAAAEAPSHAGALATRCHGFNLLDKLAATDPAMHARIREKAETIENGQAVFWKIERADRRPSYLLGTVHLTDSRITQLDETTKAAIRAATVLLIENAATPSGPTSRSSENALKSALYSDGRSLESVLTREEFEKVRQSTGGMPAEILRLYRPWMVSLMLSASDCERRRIQNGYRVLDLVIAEGARANGVPIEGLETTDQQLAALSSVPDDEQLDMLRANIALADDSESMRETMVQLYLRRRIGALWDLQLALAAKAGIPASAFATFERTLIVDRNRHMHDAAQPHLETGGAFIAVGALHLPGPHGLVSLLREAGYTLTPIE